MHFQAVNVLGLPFVTALFRILTAQFRQKHPLYEAWFYLVQKWRTVIQLKQMYLI